jgi:hypothetical protein
MTDKTTIELEHELKIAQDDITRLTADIHRLEAEVVRGKAIEQALATSQSQLLALSTAWRTLIRTLG